MLSIGPYVVIREIPTHLPGTPGDGSRTYRATERLTGLPVLLHRLSEVMPEMQGMPELPGHPALLPFTDIVFQAEEGFLVTELPPNAVPARDPRLAAQGALLALKALHGHGLAHGGLDPAQLWSVDGPVRLAGGGRYTLGGEYTVARDLQALARTLDDLGGLPPILSLLRTEPERLSAREALELLQAGEKTGETASPPRPEVGLPSPTHAPLPPTPSFAGQAVWTTAQPPGHSPSHTPAHSHIGPGGEAPPHHLPFKLDISQWDGPESGTGLPPVPVVCAPTPVTPGRSSNQASSLGWHDVNRPLHQRPAPEVTATPDTTPPPPEESALTRQGRQVRAAASQALHRLRADGERQRRQQEARRDEVAAQLAGAAAFPGVEAAPQSASPFSGEDEQPIPATQTPQERRRREHQARQEEEKLAAQLAQSLPAPPPALLPASAVQDVDHAPRPARQVKGMKMRWDDRTNTWQKVTGARPPAAARPAWLLPALAAAFLLLALLVWGLSRRAPAPAASTMQSPCCTVDFRVNGAGKARISIVHSTGTGRWKAGQVIGEVPGALSLPGAGTYTFNVTSEGFSPATVDVTVPSPEPVTINLGRYDPAASRPPRRVRQSGP